MSTKPNAPEAADVVEESDVTTADLGQPYGRTMRQLAEKLPEKDEVQKAYKEGFLADTTQEEAKAKVKAVKASPDAEDTASGYALTKVAGIANDTERGEEYLKHKTAKRWGYVPVTDS